MISFEVLDTKNYVNCFPILVSELSVNRLLKVPKLAFGSGKAQAII